MNMLQNFSFQVFIFRLVITAFSFCEPFPGIIFAQTPFDSSKSCTKKAVGLLKQQDQNGYDIYKRVSDDSYFSFWLDCDSPPLYGLPSAVHETAHKLSSLLTDYIDGKTMGPDEFEAYLNEHPELKDIPQLQELLKKMKEEKGN